VATQDDTQPIKIPYPVGKKPTGLYITIAALAVVIIVLGAVLFITTDTDNGEENNKQTPGSQGNPILSLQMAQQEIDRIGILESDLRQKQDEIVLLSKNYKENAAPDLASIDMLNLSEQEQDILRQKMNEEGDVSIKSLLEDILERNAAIQQLQGRIQKIESLLPRPHIVSKGETHFQIAWNFLVNEKELAPARAERIIKKISLFDALVPGFKVWNFYSGREYGTFVTQGNAAISPYEAKQRAKHKLVASRDRAIKELSKKEKESKKYQKQINSLYYHLDSKKNLVKKRMLKQGFLQPAKLKDISPEDFKRSVDLRKTDTIVISAAEFELKRIKKILLFPRFYIEGQDYSITLSEDKQSASLTILDKAKLKNERVLISVE